jgi:hypothetical protein
MNRQELVTVKQVILCGPADELEQILTSCLRDMGLAYQAWRPDREPPPPQENQLVLTWRHEEEERLPAGNRVINILKLM